MVIRIFSAEISRALYYYKSKIEKEGVIGFILLKYTFLGLTLELFIKFKFSRLKVALELLRNFQNFKQFSVATSICPK